MARVETGPVQFGEEDWPGIFIRGDQALHYSFTLKTLLDGHVFEGATAIERAVLRGLADTLASCKVPVEGLTRGHVEGLVMARVEGRETIERI